MATGRAAGTSTRHDPASGSNPSSTVSARARGGAGTGTVRDSRIASKPPRTATTTHSMARTASGGSDQDTVVEHRRDEREGDHRQQRWRDPLESSPQAAVRLQRAHKPPRCGRAAAAGSRRRGRFRKFFAMWLLPLSCGSGGRTRTADPSIMSRVLLPTELRRLAGCERVDTRKGPGISSLQAVRPLFGGADGGRASPLSESNRRHQPYHGCALPTELRGRVFPDDSQPVRPACRESRLRDQVGRARRRRGHPRHLQPGGRRVHRHLRSGAPVGGGAAGLARGARRRPPRHRGGRGRRWWWASGA